jgi:hypothetical protein
VLRRDYTTFKLIPDTTLKNNNNVMLAQAMASCFQEPLNRMTKKGMLEPTKFYFDIELTKNQTSFYLTIPQNLEDIVINKAKTIWDKANIHEENLAFNIKEETTELAELVLKAKPEVSRKFLHIMVGNMIFAMPFFSDPSILLWFITLPITIAPTPISTLFPIFGHKFSFSIIIVELIFFNATNKSICIFIFYNFIKFSIINNISTLFSFLKELML